MERMNRTVIKGRLKRGAIVCALVASATFGAYTATMAGLDTFAVKWTEYRNLNPDVAHAEGATQVVTKVETAYKAADVDKQIQEGIKESIKANLK